MNRQQSTSISGKPLSENARGEGTISRAAFFDAMGPMPSDSPLSPTPHPSKPRLTLRVGIAGHRTDKLHGAALARIERQLPQVFGAIEQTAMKIRAESAPVYADEPALIRLISGFAEGADQIAVAACRSSWQIEAILPFPHDEYLKDFAQSAGDGRDVRNEFRQCLAKATAVTEIAYPQSGNRDQGYAGAGGFLLRQIDVLVAVWDGKPPKTGGTGAIVREAAAGGIPVVWLSTQDNAPPRLITSLPPDGDPIAATVECTEPALRTTLGPMFAAPGHSSEPNSARADLESYLGERWKRHCWFTAYDALRRIARGLLPRLTLSLPPLEQSCHEWDSFLASAPDAPNLRERIGRVLAPRHAWADTLAVYYSHLYRSAYVFCYFLSAVAVFIALGVVFIHDDPHAPASGVLGTKALFVGCELIVIGAIILIVWLGRQRRWHQRWINYRALAELIRHGRFLAFISEFGRLQAGGPNSREAPWMLWYVRATMREIGLPTATFDSAYRQALLGATLKEEIEGPHGQIAYNKNNMKIAHEVDHFLHSLGIGCFVVTLLILAVFLALFGVDRALGIAPIETLLLATKPFVTFLSAGLPALGAAVAGIRVHGDFEASSRRSARTLDQLAGLTDDYASAAKNEADLDEIAELLIATARVLSEDVAAWQGLYGRKRLTLPA